MNSVLDSYAGQNPLLEIDTGFAAYLSARTRTFKDHIIGGRIDYAFDADFSLRQKFNTHSGWNKIYKNLVTNEIPNKFKRVFQTASQAGATQYPDVYKAAKDCSERLKINMPAVFVRNSAKLEIYTLSAENTDPAVVLTTALCEACTKEELRFLIGRECGHIQNNHCIYYMAAPSFGLVMDNDIINPVADESAGKMSAAMFDWITLSDVTADRAGIICCDNPKNYAEIMASVHSKGLNDIYSRTGCGYDSERVTKMFETLHVTPARSINLDSSWSKLEKRVFAGMEFLNCEVLFNWRDDIDKDDVHTVTKQALEVRCEIIVGADSNKKGGV